MASSSSIARSRASRRPASSSGVATFSSAVMVGIRWKDWNTTPTCARRSRASASSLMVPRSWPKARTVPPVARSSPPISISSEDLPEPDGPTSPTLSPRWTSSVIPWSIRTRPVFPSSASEASERDSRGEVMRLRLIEKGFLTYGALRGLGKVLAVMWALVSPAWAGEPVTVLAFGDSLTQGYGLPEEDGFVPQMRNWLQDQGVEAELINAGVSGDTTAGGAARVEWSLTPEVDAMIVTLGGNDLLRGLDPSDARSNLRAILESARSRDVEVLLVGMKAPGNYGAEYQTAFDSIYPDLAQEFGTLYFENFFAGLGQDDPAQACRYFQPDGIHPNSEGVERIVEALGPAVVDLVLRAE